MDREVQEGQAQTKEAWVCPELVKMDVSSGTLAGGAGADDGLGGSS